MFEINKSLQDPPSKESSLTIKDKVSSHSYERLPHWT